MGLWGRKFRPQIFLMGVALLAAAETYNLGVGEAERRQR